MTQATTFRCDYCKKSIEPKMFTDNGHPTREPILVTVDVDSPYTSTNYVFHFHRDCAPQGYGSIALMMNEIYADWEQAHLAQLQATTQMQLEAAKKNGGKIEVLPRSPTLGPDAKKIGKRGGRK